MRVTKVLFCMGE